MEGDSRHISSRTPCSTSMITWFWEEGYMETKMIGVFFAEFTLPTLSQHHPGFFFLYQITSLPTQTSQVIYPPVEAWSILWDQKDRAHEFLDSVVQACSTTRALQAFESNPGWCVPNQRDKNRGLGCSLILIGISFGSRKKIWLIRGISGSRIHL